MHARRQRLPLFLLVGLIGSAVFAAFPEAATADPAGTIVQFPVPTPSANPLVTTSGPDGNVWFTEQGANRIARITANGTITEFDVPTASSFPLGITTGPDGNLWFCEQAAGKVGRITLTGTVTEWPVGAFPSGIVAGPDGNLWFTENGSNAIGRLAPDGSGFTEFPTPTPNSRPIEIKVGLGTVAGGSTTATALTDGSGVATAPTLIANETTGDFSVNGHVNFANLDANFALTNQPAPGPTATTTATTTTAVASAPAPPAPSSGPTVGNKATSGASVRGQLPATGAYAFFSTSSLGGALIALGLSLAVMGRTRRTRRRRLRFEG